ncbi:MAG: type II toxin-antitoxin system VapC family toxin [Thermomicrobiales bacterium]
MICVDASVAVKWIIDEEFSEQALELVHRADRTGERIVAPALMPFEVGNIFRKQMRRAGMTLATAEILFAKFLNTPVEHVSSRDLHQEALRVADRFDLPAIYDAHYLALAESLGCDLWTDDRRLLRNVGSSLPFVRWIGDYRAPLSPN